MAHVSLEKVTLVLQETLGIMSEIQEQKLQATFGQDWQIRAQQKSTAEGNAGLSAWGSSDLH